MFWLAVVSAIRQKQQQEQERARAMRQQAAANQPGGFTDYSGNNKVAQAPETTSSGADMALSMIGSAANSGGSDSGGDTGGMNTDTGGGE